MSPPLTTLKAIKPCASDTKSGAKPAAIRQRLGRICRSLTVITLVLLLSFEAAIDVFKPLKMLNFTGFTGMNQYYVVSKLPEFLSSSEHPDVIMTGSSLLLVPAVRCDEHMHGKKARFDHYYYRNVIDSYLRADYLQKLIRERAGNHLIIANLGTLAGMVSDQFLIFKKSLGSGKKPKLLICDVAPRGFLDRNRKEYDKTPVYIVLADYTCLGDLIKSKADLNSICVYAIGSLWRYFHDRADYRTVVMRLLAHVSGHPADMFTASMAPKGGTSPPAEQPKSEITAKADDVPDYVEKPNTLSDIGGYEYMYQKVDRRQMKKQLEFLEQTLELAQQSGVKVLLVKMPLTNENKILLDADISADLNRQIDAIAAKYRAAVCDPSMEHDYSLADFEDSSHMNRSGGEKFFDTLSKKIIALLSDR
ncbi:MAG TPA: DUF1574 family protein [Candidatus Obscuribacterales bacterium]